MSFESVLLGAEADVKIAVADALKVFGVAVTKAPAAVVGLTALAASVEKALADTAADVTNPTQLVLTFAGQVADFKAVWPDVKAFLASVGIK
jgi:hypothetical protein